MIASICLLLLFSVAIQAHPCNRLFPSTGGIYSESCMFNGHGMFTSLLIGKENEYYLMNDSVQPNDFEYYKLPVNKTLSPITSDEKRNCVVEQSMMVWNPSNKNWDLQKTATSEVNVLGNTVYLTPGVVPVNGMCVSTRLFGRACSIAGKTMLQQLNMRGKYPFMTPSDVEVACGI